MIVHSVLCSFHSFYVTGHFQPKTSRGACQVFSSTFRAGWGSQKVGRVDGRRQPSPFLTTGVYHIDVKMVFEIETKINIKKYSKADI